MTREQLVERLRAGGLWLMFDTSALYSDIVRIATLASRWNQRLEADGRKPVRLSVSALAHAEKIRQLRQKFGADFSEEQVVAGLRNKSLKIVGFRRQHATWAGVRMGAAHPTDAGWIAFKKSASYRCLGLDPAVVASSSSGRKCGATVDWLIGAHAGAVGAVVCGNDGGPEWQGLDRCKKEMLREALDELTREVP